MIGPYFQVKSEPCQPSRGKLEVSELDCRPFANVLSDPMRKERRGLGRGRKGGGGVKSEFQAINVSSSFALPSLTSPFNQVHSPRVALNLLFLVLGPATLAHRLVGFRVPIHFGEDQNVSRLAVNDQQVPSGPGVKLSIIKRRGELQGETLELTSSIIDIFDGLPDFLVLVRF